MAQIAAPDVGRAASLLCMRNVRKQFGAVTALAGVDLDVRPGEVHALLGENGAGKSTLMKVLSGALAPDAGMLTLAGTDYRPRGPRDAGQRGVAMIYQELTLAPHLTIAQNIALGREPRRFGLVLGQAASRRAEQILARLGHPELDVERRVAELGPGPRQLVEVARALSADARLVVMDEPTSSLSTADAERLFQAIMRLREDGVAVIYISHFLEEVARIADRFTVLRDGRTVATGDMQGTTRHELIAHMVGRPLDALFPRVAHTPGEALLELSDVAGLRLPRGVNLSVRRGEILGIAGLVGAGRSELLRALFGLEPMTRGRVQVTGRPERDRSPAGRMAQGIGLLSEDRKDEGLALTMSVADNLTLSHLSRTARFGFLRPRQRQARVQRWLEALSVRAPDAGLPVGTLSGGNQQKVALARLLDLDVDVLLLDEPTRGVDVGSKADIYRLMGQLAADGKALVFVSSYIPELLGVCDRIAVMHRGQLGRPRPAAEWSEEGLLSAVFSGETASVHAASGKGASGENGRSAP